MEEEEKRDSREDILSVIQMVSPERIIGIVRLLHVTASHDLKNSDRGIVWKTWVSLLLDLQHDPHYSKHDPFDGDLSIDSLIARCSQPITL